jgi:pimeloyl-ACP methyl ester carboxylesterase
VTAATGFEALSLDANGFRFDAIARGEDSAPLVLFLHGWPSFATSWREVMAPVAAAGFRAVAVDQRGYSRGAANYADRLASLTFLSTPHAAAFREAMRSDPQQPVMSAYISVFRQPGHVAEQALLRDDAHKLRALYSGKLSPEAIEDNVGRFSEPGLLTATLNWYRALDNKRLGSPVAAPTLYVWGSEDQAFGATAATATGRFVTGPYQFAPLEGASHWLPEEAPETIARLLLAHIGKFPA